MSLTELQRWAVMVAFVFGGCSAMAVGPATRPITVESTTVLSSDAPRTPHVESWLAANPRDPKNLIAVTDAINGTAASGVAIYYTRYHQLGMVRQALADVREHGAGIRAPERRILGRVLH